MKNILFLNHKQQQCGVYQYGYRSAMILKISKEFNFIYKELENKIEFLQLVIENKPYAIIYNYHPSTMSWLNSAILNELPHITHYGIHHEGNETSRIQFDNYILTDSTKSDTDGCFSVPRPLFKQYNTGCIFTHEPIIGSFGFGFNNKGFERLVKLVNEQFDNCTIRLHIPFAHYGDMYGHSAKLIADSCKRYITKDKIQIVITHNFFSDNYLLQWLSMNNINCFLYDEMPGRGLSSVIDYALSVNRPIAISKTTMFRHIVNTSPSICVEDRTIKDIMESESKVLRQYRDKWSNENFISKYEYILNETIKL